MDKATEKRLDTIVEDEVRKGYRIKELPKDLQQELQEEGLAPLVRVRFTRLNPARRRKISEVVQRRYHQDLKNADILSHEQLLKLVTERGEWNEQMTKDMRALQETVNRRMGILYFAQDSDNTMQELWAKTDEYRQIIKELGDETQRDEALVVFNRWVDYTPDAQTYYDEQHASAQGRTTYSGDVDLQRLLVLVPAPTARVVLETVEGLRDRAQDLLLLQRDRIRLMEMQTKHAKIFSDSAEQRRDNAEEMARMYFCTEQVDEAGKPQGPLTPTFEAMYDFPEAVVQWLLLESYFFQQGIPDEAREYLEALGFLGAVRKPTETASANSESEASAESPVPQNSKADSEAPVRVAAASSGSAADTISTTPSSPS